MTSENLVNFNQTTRHYDPEDGHLHSRRHENHKPRLVTLQVSLSHEAVHLHFQCMKSHAPGLLKCVDMFAN
jgi:hypothetical protein